MSGIYYPYILESEENDTEHDRPTAVVKGMKMFQRSFTCHIYYNVLKKKTILDFQNSIAAFTAK